MAQEVRFKKVEHTTPSEFSSARMLIDQLVEEFIGYLSQKIGPFRPDFQPTLSGACKRGLFWQVFLADGRRGFELEG